MNEDEFSKALNPANWRAEHHLHTPTLNAHLTVDGELSLSGVAIREGLSQSDVQALTRFLAQYVKVEPLPAYDESLENEAGRPVNLDAEEEQYPGYPHQFVTVEPLANRPYYYYRLHSKFSLSDVSITSLGLLELADWLEKERATLEKEAERERTWKQEQEEAEQPEKPERYTCWILKQLGVLTTDDFGHACCPYCHKINNQSHEEEENLDESQVLTYIKTPKGRVIGLCCDVLSYATVSTDNVQANAWLDEAIDKLDNKESEEQA